MLKKVRTIRKRVCTGYSYVISYDHLPLSNKGKYFPLEYLSTAERKKDNAFILSVA